MAVSALHSAATGLQGLSTEIDVIANNLANVNTNGFKASRVNFEDLLYETKRQPGVENALGSRSPAGLQVGGGVRISNTQYDFTKGDARVTNKPLDVMIDGDGFFQVQIPTDQGPGGIGYARAGNFFANADGDLVFGNNDGPLLVDGINIPPGTPPEAITISPTGLVSIEDAGGSTPVGQLTLATFVNRSGLKSIGGNLFVETEASGPSSTGNPQDAGFGKLIQGHIESSNVDPVTELVTMIKTQRAFELNSQTIQAADEVLEVVSNLRRF